MRTSTYDTHDFIKKFIHASEDKENISERQAEIIAEYVQEGHDVAIDNLATKNDIKLVEQKLDSKIDSVEQKLIGEIKDVRNEIKNVEQKLDSRISSVEQKLDNKIDKMFYKLLLAIPASTAALLGIFSIIIKTFF